MPTVAGLKRKSFFVDTRTLRRARKALGVATDAEAVRRAVERVAEMEVFWRLRSEEHTSELQSRGDLVCRLLLEKKKKTCASDPANPSDHCLSQRLRVIL